MKVLAGIHAVKHALESGAALDELLIEKDKRHPRLNELIHLARRAGVSVSFVPKARLERLAEGVPHQGAAAIGSDGREPVQSFEEWLESLSMETQPLLLLLDQVTDPHNLGACVRTAEAAGCAAVIVPKDHSADQHSPVTAKAACGALSRLPLFRVVNLKRAIGQLQQAGFWTVGLAGGADASLYEVGLSGAVAVVMGSEGRGMRRLVSESCDQLVSIPMPGRVESLNVSVATGVALFEINRQRRSS